MLSLPHSLSWELDEIISLLMINMHKHWGKKLYNKYLTNDDFSAHRIQAADWLQLGQIAPETVNKRNNAIHCVTLSHAQTPF